MTGRAAAGSPPAGPPSGGQIVANIMHFGRVLRAAGLPIGPGRVLDAIRSVRTVGIVDREDFYWTLHAVFVNRRDQRELFDQAFHIFWRNPGLLERMLAAILPAMAVPEDESGREQLSPRLAEALLGAGGEQQREEREEREINMTMTWSDREVLSDMDFEKMTAAEVLRARAVVARMRLPIMELPTRRFHPVPGGPRIDMRATLRASLRQGGTIPLRRRAPRRRHPPLVALCDISGSMSRYSRMLIHFMHAVTSDRDRVHTFLFGTRLTNVTRQLRHRDIDQAMERVANAAGDWSGGTRIGPCISEFNRDWSRRVLGQGAVVLLISDGLERDDSGLLDREMDRLHRSCRRLIWLNPLLRWDGFSPKARGIRAILPHVDDFRTVHNLESLRSLAEALGREGNRHEEAARRAVA